MAHLLDALDGVPFNIKTGTTYTTTPTDTATMIIMSNANSNIATIKNSVHELDTELHLLQWGAGETTIAISGGTLNVESTYTKVLAGQYAVATAKKITSTEWVLFGNLTAA